MARARKLFVSRDAIIGGVGLPGRDLIAKARPSTGSGWGESAKPHKANTDGHGQTRTRRDKHGRDLIAKARKGENTKMGPGREVQKRECFCARCC